MKDLGLHDDVFKKSTSEAGGSSTNGQVGHTATEPDTVTYTHQLLQCSLKKGRIPAGTVSTQNSRMSSTLT